MPSTKLVTGTAAIIAAGALIGTGAAQSGAATGIPSPTASATTTPSAGLPGGHVHTPVTGDELAEVTAAVTGQDPAVTVASVRKDPDGSYDVDGTKAGAPVRLEVSADLQTITAHPGGKGPRTPGSAPSSRSGSSTAI